MPESIDLTDEDKKKALAISYRLLALKDRSSNDIATRLRRKGFSEQTINSVVATLKGQGYINEDRLLESLKTVALREKNYGRYAIKGFLQSKGIDESVCNSICLSSEDYEDAARRFVVKRLRLLKGLSEQDRRRKLSLMLQRRGHDPETIKRALNLGGEEDV